MSDIRHLAQRVLDLDAQATEGPWETDGVYDLYVFSKPRARTIAEYRTAAPALARALLAALDENARLRKALAGASDAALAEASKWADAANPPVHAAIRTAGAVRKFVSAALTTPPKEGA